MKITTGLALVGLASALLACALMVGQFSGDGRSYDVTRAKRILDESRRTGFSIEDVQRLVYTLEQGGLSHDAAVDALVDTIRWITSFQQLYGIEPNSAEARKTLRTLNITGTEARELTPQEIFWKMHKLPGRPISQ